MTDTIISEIIEIAVDTKLVSYICPRCHKGTMQWDGEVWWDWWQGNAHYCSECRYKEYIKGHFPYIKYEISDKPFGLDSIAKRIREKSKCGWPDAEIEEDRLVYK